VELVPEDRHAVRQGGEADVDVERIGEIGQLAVPAAAGRIPIVIDLGGPAAGTIVAKQEPAAPTVARRPQLQLPGDEAVGRVQPVVDAVGGRMGAELDSVRG
jgi:hypothetical protein